MSDAVKPAKKAWRMPDTYTIIFFVVAFAAILTYIVPVGMFTAKAEAANGKSVLVPGSYTNSFVLEDGKLIPDAAGTTHTKPLPVFAPFGDMGVLN